MTFLVEFLLQFFVVSTIKHLRVLRLHERCSELVVESRTQTFKRFEPPFDFRQAFHSFPTLRSCRGTHGRDSFVQEIKCALHSGIFGQKLLASTIIHACPSASRTLPSAQQGSEF